MSKRKSLGTESEEITRIAAYLRVSTFEQKESGLGIAAQKTKCIAMTVLKGWTEPTFYIDEAVSGTKEAVDRPALAQLCEDISQGKYQALIIPSLDRLGRKTSIVLKLVEDFAEQDVALISCKENLDTSTPQGQFVLTLFAALAQLEREMIMERTAAAIEERAKKDGERGGRLPYGYVRTDEGIAIDEDAAKVVKRIFSLHRRGYSLRKIEADVGKRHSSIVEILNNRAIYKGAKRGKSDVRWPSILK